MATPTEALLFVIGYANDGIGGAVVRPHDAPPLAAGAHLNMRPDMSHPITRARCAALLETARKMTGRDLYQITIQDSEWTKTPGNEYADFPETCLRDKQYQYDGRTGELLILDKGQAVYLNDGHSILRGDDASVAYTDSLDV